MSQISYSLKGAAEATGLSIRALQYAIDDGLLIAHYYGAKPVIHAGDLDTYIRSLPTESARRAAAS